MRLKCSSSSFLNRKKVNTKKYQKILELKITNSISTALLIVAVLNNATSQNIE